MHYKYNFELCINMWGSFGLGVAFSLLIFILYLCFRCFPGNLISSSSTVRDLGVDPDLKALLTDCFTTSVSSVLSAAAPSFILPLYFNSRPWSNLMDSH